MNKLVFGTILQLFFLTCSIQAQKSSTAENAALHRVYVDFTKNNEIEYLFNVVKGSSVYGLAKVFDLDVPKIYRYNGLAPGTSIETGTMLRVPLHRQHIVFSPPAKRKSIVLLYKVKPKETLYHISKRKMNIDTEVLKKMNGLVDDQLREGGEIILGWYVVESKEAVKHKTNVTVKPEKKQDDVRQVKTNADVKEDAEKEGQEEPVELSRKRVIGYWDKTNETKKGLFVLSDLAKPGTKMELYYPMNRTRVTATVIGRIPPATYPEETEIFISPEVAQKLGIFDTRFSVVTRFESL